MVEIVIGAASVVVAIVAIFAGIRQRRRKELAFAVAARTPLLRTQERVSEKLQIVFGEETVEDVHLFACAIENTGNQEILPSEYGGAPLRLVLSPESSAAARILTADFLAKPEGSDARATVSDNAVEIPPVLINSGDRMALQVVVAALTGGDIQLQARIAGVKLTKLRLTTPMWWRIATWTVGAAGWGLLMIGLASDEQNYLVVGLGIAVMVAAISVRAELDKRTAKRRAEMAGGLPTGPT